MTWCANSANQLSTSAARSCAIACVIPAWSRARRQGDLRLQGFGHDGVGELEPPGQVGLRQQAGGQRRIGAVEHDQGRLAGHLGEDVDVEGAAQHAGDGEELLALRKAADPAAHDVLDGGGHTGAVAGAVEPVEGAFAGEQRQHLADEERVAAGPRPNQSGRARRPASPPFAASHSATSPSVSPASSARTDPGSGRGSPQAVDQRRVGLGGDRSHGHDEQHQQPAQLGGDELDHPERRRVGPAGRRRRAPAAVAPRRGGRRSGRCR